MTDKSFVTLEQHLCQVCGKPFDTGALLLDRRLHDRFEHHTVTGNGLCPDDQAKLNEDYVALVAVDPSKSGIADNKTLKPAEAYRTGALAHVRRSVYEKIFNVPVPKGCPMVFCEPEVISMLEKMQKVVLMLGGDDAVSTER
jgi:hypothetical protein